jgi:hypothetical protein
VRPRAPLGLPAPAPAPRSALPPYPGSRARGPLAHLVGVPRAERPQEPVAPPAPRKATASAPVARRTAKKGVQIVEGTPYSPTRLYWPSGRMRPMPGDDVYAVVAGIMGASFVSGKAVKRGNAVRVVAQGKSRPASELWNVVGDPAIEAAKAEKQRQKSDAATRKEEIKREAVEAVDRHAESRGLVQVKSIDEVFVGQTLHRLYSEGEFGDGDPSIVHDDSITVADVGRDEWTYRNEYGTAIPARVRGGGWWRERSAPPAPRKRWQHSGGRPSYGTPKPAPIAARSAAVAPPPMRGITAGELVSRYKSMPSSASFVASRDVPEGMAAAGGDALFTPRALAALQIGRLLSRRVESEGLGLAASKVLDDLQTEAGRVNAGQFDRVTIRTKLAFRGDEDLGAWVVGIPTADGVVIDSADAIADDAVIASGNAVPMAAVLRGEVQGPSPAIITVDGERVTITRHALRLLGLVVRRLRARGYGDEDILANLRLTLRQLKRDVAKASVTVRPGEPVMGTLWFGGETTRLLVRDDRGEFIVDADPPPRIERAEPEFSPRIDYAAVAQRVGRVVTPKDLIPGDLVFVPQNESGTRLVVGHPRAIKHRGNTDWSVPAKDASGRDFPMLLRDGVRVEIVSTPLPHTQQEWPDPALWEVVGVPELATGDWILLRDPSAPDGVLAVERIAPGPQTDTLTLHLRDTSNAPVTIAMHYAASVGRWPASKRLAVPMRPA